MADEWTTLDMLIDVYDDLGAGAQHVKVKAIR
jgi:hypothetical protein